MSVFITTVRLDNTVLICMVTCFVVLRRDLEAFCIRKTVTMQRSNLDCELTINSVWLLLLDDLKRPA